MCLIYCKAYQFCEIRVRCEVAIRRSRPRDRDRHTRAAQRTHYATVFILRNTVSKRPGASIPVIRSAIWPPNNFGVPSHSPPPWSLPARCPARRSAGPPRRLPACPPAHAGPPDDAPSTAPSAAAPPPPPPSPRHHPRRRRPRRHRHRPRRCPPQCYLLVCNNTSFLSI